MLGIFDDRLCLLVVKAEESSRLAGYRLDLATVRMENLTDQVEAQTAAIAIRSSRRLHRE